MKQILFLAIFIFAVCAAYTPSRRYPSSSYSQPSLQYGNSASSGSSQQVPILRQDSTNTGDGTYSYAYETANGIAGQEQGDARGQGTKALGAYSYTSPNGQPVQVQYTADENGFVPQGSHLPVGLLGPLRKSIEKNLAEERRGVVDDGQYKSGQSSVPKYTSTQQKFNVPQKITPQKTVTAQKYTPTRYTPQRYNTAQQYRPPQPASTKYLPPVYSRPQSSYKY